MSSSNQHPSPARTTPASAVSVLAPSRVPQGAAAAGPAAATRTGRVRLTRVDPWSVLVVTFTLASVLAFVAAGASALLYAALDQLGVVAAVNDVYNTLIDPVEDGAAVPAGPVTLGRTVLVTGVLGGVLVVLASTVAAVTAFAYNAAARLSGGLRFTLREN